MVKHVLNRLIDKDRALVVVQESKTGDPGDRLLAVHANYEVTSG